MRHHRVQGDVALLVRHGLHRARLVAEDQAVDPVAAVGERPVRTRHLERSRRLGAETDREVAAERRRDAEIVRCLAHGVRTDDRGEL